MAQGPRARNLLPGGWAVESERTIATLLGSCVAVCLYDAQLHLAGMNHFLLPKINKRAHADHDVVLSGDYAMEVLLNAMMQKGARKTRITAKAFGGGSIHASRQFDVGRSNVEFAVQWLREENIPLVASDFGGSYSRKLLLHPDTGDAFCRRMEIKSSVGATLAKREQAYALSLVQAPKPGQKKIELF